MNIYNVHLIPVFMNLKASVQGVMTVLLFIIIVGLLFSYFFLPYPGNEFFVKSGDVNAPSYTNSSIQFYPDMRFPEKSISYKIIDCPVKKMNDMLDSFQVMENLTVLSFYAVDNDEEITITCSSEAREAEKTGYFIAGEGGPTNITVTDNFNVIHRGKILLLRDSKCEHPNVGIHELLHVLGFTHSPNEDSIMYEVSSCSQVITSDITNEINRLYKTPTLPDLIVKNLTAETNGRYLDVTFKVVNHGLAKSGKSEAFLYVNDQELSKISINPLEIGYGTEISLKNVKLPFGKTETISLDVNTSFDELSKKNNKIELIVSD